MSFIIICFLIIVASGPRCCMLVRGTNCID